jgi:branched-chain amino acid aminotransferase
MHTDKPFPSPIQPKTPRSQETPFGRDFLPNMAYSDFAKEHWSPSLAVSYSPFAFSPACSALHYGQIGFEGLKAHPAKGRLLLFRPQAHHRRLQTTCDRLAMPCPPYAVFLNALKQVLDCEEARTCSDAGKAIYLRPVIMATEAFLGVRPSETYRLFVLACEAKPYFSTGPARAGGHGAQVNEGLRLRTETAHFRACPGGTGAVKTPGNYAASLAAAAKAKQAGYSDVLWLNALDARSIEEAGAMNVFFAIGGEVVTPALSGSILPGITRDTVLRLLRHLGVTVRETRIDLDMLAKAEEAFGTGTAAGIAPIASISHEGKVLFGAPSSLSTRLQAALGKLYGGESTLWQAIESDDRELL